MVFDYHHYDCYPNYNKDMDIKNRRTAREIIPDVLETWKKLGVRPKFHLSEQMKGKQVGTHSLFIEKIPDEFLEIPSKHGVEIDIMIEAKGKEVAIGKLYSKYPQLRKEGSYDLPKKIPKAALDNLKVSEEIKELTDCECSKEPVMTRMIKDGDYYLKYIKYRNLYRQLKN